MYKEDGAQILEARKNILYTILHVTSSLFNEWRDVKTQKSQLTNELEFDLYYKLHNK